jgi:hypothetical protein
LGFDSLQAFPLNEVRDHMHPIEVQSGTRLGPRDLTSIELLVICVNERLGARGPGNFKGIVTGFDAECGVPG